MSYKTDFTPRYPNQENIIPLEKSREIDFNKYQFVMDGDYFLKGKTEKEGYYFILEGLDENKNKYRRRLYLSCTEIGSHYTFIKDEIDLTLKKYTNLYWPRLFFKDWTPYENKDNVFMYRTVDNLTIITGIVDRPFGVVWTYGGPDVIFNKETYIEFRNKSGY